MRTPAISGSRPLTKLQPDSGIAGPLHRVVMLGQTEGDMLRATYKANKFVGETESQAVDVFLAEIIEVCRKHGMSISHDDGQGAFRVVRFNDADSDWLMFAANKTETA